MTILTPRQIEVGLHASSGLLPHRIAREMGLSRETVKSHIKQAAERIGDSGPAPAREKLVWFIQIGSKEQGS